MKSMQSPSILNVRAAIKDYDAQIEVLKTERALVIHRMQNECKHPNILEAEYQSDTLGGCYHTPPFHVCVDCGLAEEGWGCGYWRLDTRGEVPRISREKARRDYVLTFRTQEQMNKERYGK